MKCFYCESEILENEGMIYPLDEPYVNLRVHRICARAIDMEFLQKNYDRILEYIGQPIQPTQRKAKRK